MFDWLPLDRTILLWLTGVSVLTFVGTLVFVPMVVIALPADYFNRHKRRQTIPPRHPVVRLVGLIVKNVIGAVLFLAGLIMLGLPGQGLLTMAAGILMMDFPGKYALEKKLVSTSPVLKSMNWIRQRRGKAPLEAPEH